MATTFGDTSPHAGHYEPLKKKKKLDSKAKMLQSFKQSNIGDGF